MTMKPYPFCTTLLAFVMSAALLSPTLAQSFDQAGLTKYLYPNPQTTGFGRVLDDLESMAVGPHQMRNESDPGNWAHELTHHVNAAFRSEASRIFGRQGNGFYVLSGYAIMLPEPNVTLKQVATLIPQKHRSDTYKEYVIASQRWWNKEPLFMLDEAVAAMNGLEYHVDKGTPDRGREILMRDWLVLVPYLLEAVEKFDPGYSHHDELKNFISWQLAYADYLATLHNRLDD